MNDLERDLQQLFEQRAREVDPAVLAPEAIIRRGHRRQARTVVGGVLAGVVAIAVAVAAVGSIQGPDGAVPGGADPWPARSTVIGGVPVTAPAGWTLIDDTPMLNVVAVDTIDTCTFSASGTEVDSNGSPVASGPAPEPSTSCASAVADMPAGVPFLQLANFDVPLMASVCDWSGGPATPLPPDGVAIYVASFPSGMDSRALLDACPGADRYGSITGENAYTFGLATKDGATGLTMAVAAVAGSDASEEDLAVARSFFDQPIFGQTNPYVALDPNRVGPGYVLASGGTPQEGWRLEAGIKSFANDGKPMPASIFVTAGSGSETATWDATVGGNSEDLHVVAGQVVQHGNLASGFTGVDITGPNGDVTHAAVYPWPQNLLAIAQSQAFDNAGGIWIATPPQEGDVVPTRPGDPINTETASPDPTPAAQRLDYQVLDSGAVVGTGNDFGSDWQLTDSRGSLHLVFGGVDMEIFSATVGGSEQQDVPGGTLWILREPLSTDRVYASTDVAGANELASGRWMPSDERSMGHDRIWVVALPGTGTGYSQVAGRLALEMHWPTIPGPPAAGVAISAGSDGATSWAIRWTGQCPTIEITESRNTDAGTSDCLVPWDGSTPTVSGVYGEHEALVMITGPENMLCSRGASGGSIAPLGQWAHTGQCVLTVPVGTSVTVQLTDVSGNPILGASGRITLQVEPGRVNATN